MLLLMAW